MKHGPDGVFALRVSDGFKLPTIRSTVRRFIVKRRGIVAVLG